MAAEIQFRFAVREDVPLILKFIRDLAAYENLLDKVAVSEAILEDWLFDQPKAEVIFCELAGRPIGFTLFFYNFSTFLGQSGIFLEDLYIEPAYRGRGYGKAIFGKLAEIAIERGCGRLDWWCLNWNKPSIDFYESLGAKHLEEWRIYRLSRENLLHLLPVKNEKA
ncbi:MAG: GNAT family N-acetyltransferase [Acholeplasmataceae bacterium]|nr:GNAT family N-acetyltransferase [Acholeplasmataceae bacterium]